MVPFRNVSVARPVLAAHAAMVTALLVACAAPPTAGATTLEARILVKLVRPADNGAAIAAEAARQAGVPVRYAAAASPVWHALVLQCVDAAACEAAIDRLRRASGTYEAIERDQRKRPAVT